MLHPHRTLWRIVTQTGQALSDARAPVLCVHLAHAPLTSMLVQRAGAQRAYLALTGCAGCALGRCLPGCHANLLRRGLHAAVADELTLVRAGLVVGSPTAAVCAWPTKAAQPLDQTLLGPWPDARLTLDWRGVAGGVAVAATLLTCAGPAPAAALRAAGWHPLPLPWRWLRHWQHHPLPPPFPLGRCWPHAPYLLTAAAAPTTTPVATSIPPDHVHPALDQSLATWLAQVLTDSAAGPHHAPVHAAPAAPAALAALVPQLLAEPAFRSTRTGQSGLTKGRLVGLRHPALSEATARALMVWFDQAGVLAAPAGGQSPWRAPRPLITTDLDAIAAQLRATPLPAAAAVRAAYGEPSNEIHRA